MSMIATEVASPFLTPLKFTLVAAVTRRVPFVLYQIWAFVAPGLYRHEKRLAMPLLVSSVLLFYAGMAFAYFVVFPIVFGFFVGIAPDGRADDDRHQGLPRLRACSMFFAFGIAFEVPVAVVILLRPWASSTSTTLAEKRPYVIVGAFVIGAVLDAAGRDVAVPAGGADADPVRDRPVRGQAPVPQPRAGGRGRRPPEAHQPADGRHARVAHARQPRWRRQEGMIASAAPSIEVGAGHV
ncbi:MAG: twin-arginine translocase subunit TatC [Chromatiales bacterium]|nr:twin-arginine translocase subunit TatC [Chromatiales bacterium]